MALLKTLAKVAEKEAEVEQAKEDERPPLAHRIVSDGERVGFACAFIPGIEQVFKSKLGAWWLPQAKMWVTSVNRVRQLGPQLDEIFSGYQYRVKTRGLAKQAARAIEKSRPGCFSYALNVRLLPLETGHTVIISDFDRILRNHLEKAGEWHASHMCHVSQYKPEQIANFLIKRGVYPEAIYTHPTPLPDFDPADWASENRPRLKVGEGAEMDFGAAANAQFKKVMDLISKPMEEIPFDPKVIAEATARFGLYDYQGAGVEHLIKYSSSLLADDMGLGKTRQAMVAAFIRSEPGLPNIILAPASMRIGWAREIEALIPDARVWQVGESWVGRREPNWIVTSYEGLGAVLDMKFGVMIIDEAHYLKELGTVRTCNAFLVDAKHKYLLTGTPLLNTEREIHTLLKLGGHPIGQMPLPMFEHMFSGNKILRRQLGEHIKSWMLRRTKDLVLKLPGKHRTYSEVTPAGDFTEQYEQLKENATLLPMVKIGQARQMLELAKVNYISDYVGSLAQEDKIIVFCQYKQSIAAFQAAFEGLGIGYVTLTGEDNMKKRQQAIDGFQTDPKKRIFLATIDAAYVAITLTAANYVSFASQPLTPGKMAQAEDRAYRNGQKRGVFVDVPLIPGTLDDAICKLLDHKRAIAGDVMLEANPDEAKQKELEDKAALEAAAACGLIKSGALVKEKQKTMAL